MQRCTSNRDAIWVVDSGRPSELYIRLRHRSLQGKGRFWGYLPPHGKVYGENTVSCRETAHPIEMPFGLYTRVGPQNHVLGGGLDPQNGQFLGLCCPNENTL